jgi:hypothetical protein
VLFKFRFIEEIAKPADSVSDKMNGTVATIMARDRAIRHGGSTGRVYERERDFALLGWWIPCYTGENRLDEVK